MQYQIQLTARHRPEVLERILRVVRHRGFTVAQMNVQVVNGEVQMQFNVESEREQSLLINQLEKLPDVIAIQA